MALLTSVDHDGLAAYSLLSPLAEMGELARTLCHTTLQVLPCHGTGALVACGVLLGRRSESPPEQSDRAGPGRSCVKTLREKAEEKRQAKLNLINEQVQQGTLVIRSMTDEERRRYPPRSAPPKRSWRR